MRYTFSFQKEIQPLGPRHCFNCKAQQWLQNKGIRQQNATPVANVETIFKTLAQAYAISGTL